MVLSIISDHLANQNILITGCTPGSSLTLYYGYTKGSITTSLFNYICPANETVTDYRYLPYWTALGNTHTTTFIVESSTGAYSNQFNLSKWSS